MTTATRHRPHLDAARGARPAEAGQAPAHEEPVPDLVLHPGRRASTSCSSSIPTFASFYFSLTRWTLFDVEFIGFDNFVTFFQEPQLVQGFINTFIYAFVTSGAKVVLGLAARRLPELADHRPRVPARRWSSSRCSSAPSASASLFKVLMDPFDGLDQRGARRRSASRDPAGSPIRRSRSSRSRSSTSGRASASRRSSTSPASSRSRRSTSRREGRRRERVEHASGTSPCRSLRPGDGRPSCCSRSSAACARSTSSGR